MTKLAALRHTESGAVLADFTYRCKTHTVRLEPVEDHRAQIEAVNADLENRGWDAIDRIEWDAVEAMCDEVQTPEIKDAYAALLAWEMERNDDLERRIVALEQKFL